MESGGFLVLHYHHFSKRRMAHNALWKSRLHAQTPFCQAMEVEPRMKESSSISSNRHPFYKANPAILFPEKPLFQPTHTSSKTPNRILHILPNAWHMQAFLL
jgi:hypothetical protein